MPRSQGQVRGARSSHPVASVPGGEDSANRGAVFVEAGPRIGELPAKFLRRRTQESTAEIHEARRFVLEEDLRHRNQALGDGCVIRSATGGRTDVRVKPFQPHRGQGSQPAHVRVEIRSIRVEAKSGKTTGLRRHVDAQADPQGRFGFRSGFGDRNNLRRCVKLNQRTVVKCLADEFRAFGRTVDDNQFRRDTQRARHLVFHGRDDLEPQSRVRRIQKQGGKVIGFDRKCQLHRRVVSSECPGKRGNVPQKRRSIIEIEGILRRQGNAHGFPETISRSTAPGRPMTRKCSLAKYSPSSPSAKSCAPEKSAMMQARKANPGTAAPEIK